MTPLAAARTAIERGMAAQPPAKKTAGAGPTTAAWFGTSPTISSGPAAQMGNRISLKKRPIVASAAVMCTIITMGKTIEPSHQK